MKTNRSRSKNQIQRSSSFCSSNEKQYFIKHKHTLNTYISTNDITSSFNKTHHANGNNSLSEIRKKLFNKLKNKSRDHLLLDKYYDNLRENYFVHDIPFQKVSVDTYRRDLIRNYLSQNSMDKRGRSMMYYDKEIEYENMRKEKDMMRIIKISDDFYKRKNDDLFKIKKKIEQNNNTVKRINSMDQFYETKAKRRLKLSTMMANELLDINCPEYEDINDGKMRKELINENNLIRKIKKFSIERNSYDQENDELCEKNIVLLKKLLRGNIYDSTRLLKNKFPDYIKKKFRLNTMNKFIGYNGVFMGVSK